LGKKSSKGKKSGKGKKPDAGKKSDTNDPRPYRPCVGIMLFNAAGDVFVGNRVDTGDDSWQMPQGGIDRGESARDAALRELKEEVGIDKVQILAKTSRWLDYDLPEDLSRRIWKGRYRGQTQRWFAMRFLGSDAEIALDNHHRESTAYQWVPIDWLVDLIIPFKRLVYQQVVEEFRELARPVAGPADDKSGAGQANS